MDEHDLDVCERMTDDLTADSRAARCALAAEAGVAFDTVAPAAAGREPSWISG